MQHQVPAVPPHPLKLQFHRPHSLHTKLHLSNISNRLFRNRFHHQITFLNQNKYKCLENDNNTASQCDEEEKLLCFYG